MSLLLRGGKLVDPSQNLEKKADVLIKKGKVVDLGKIAPKKTWDVIEVPRCIVAPGFVDMHVHLREPGREDKETIATGARAAAAGGFTGIACMPNTEPVNDSATVTNFIRSKARQAGLVNVYPIGAVTRGQKGKELAEIGEMVQVGVVAVSDDGNPIDNPQLMRRALEYSKIFDIPIIDHCEDRALAAGGCMNEGSSSTRLGLPALSRAAEELDIARDVILSRITGGRVHVAHLSTKESLDWIRDAKAKGIAITCEVTPHHFTLTDEDIGDYDTNFKMNPPLREDADVDAMLQGLADGSIDCIVTDHAPHTPLDKEMPFEAAANGIVGLETAIPLSWEVLVKSEVVSLSRLVELFSVNPSRILGLDRGSLRPGAVADVTVIDPKSKLTVDVAEFKSKGRNSPFHGWELQGAPVLTVVGGRIVYQRT